jgi:hypothetical protein
MYPDAHSVSVFDGAALAGGAMVASNGTWSVATSPLSAGTHRLTAVAFDTAGNRSASSSALTVTI